VAVRVDDTAPRWCVRLVGELHAADERAIALAGTLSARQLNWRARRDSWSIGQCLEHLRITNDVYLGAIANALARQKRAVVHEITPGVFGRWFIRNVIEPSPRTKRRRAPAKIVPAAEVEADILERFLKSNDNARKVVERAGGYDVNRIRFRNPFVPVIRFSVGTGLEILVRHQRRHLLQAEGIRDTLLRDGMRFNV
jgi:hypothetical protein